jgi:non-specific serine/threonine protein kinase
LNRVAVKISVATTDRSRSTTELQIYEKLGSTDGYREQLVALLDSFLHESANGVHVCLVLEVMGPNLTSLVRLSPECQYGQPWDRRMPKQWAKAVLRSTLQGLQVLHENGIVHGDLQTGNILLPVQERFLSMSLQDLNQAPNVQDTLKRIDGKDDPWAPRYLLVPQPLFDPTAETSLESKIGDFGGGKCYLYPRSALTMR